jgi:hypothetical protein
MIQAAFTFSGVPTYTGYQVTFINTTTGFEGGPSYQWNFGDGSTFATDSDPIYTYTIPGNYVVSFTVTDETTGEVSTYTFGSGPELPYDVDVFGASPDKDPDDGIQVRQVVPEGVEPRVALYTSNDGGQTWKNPIYASLGRTGQYRHRARFQRLGTSRNRVFKVVISEAVKVQMIGALLDMTVDGA